MPKYTTNLSAGGFRQLATVIEPKERGEYQLIVTYKIADETLIDAVKVVVM